MIEVSNPGATIAAAHLPRLFDRFYRIDAARHDNGAHRGHGLGLAIVKAVADAHGGRVELLDAPGGGSRFVVSLPAAAGTPVRSDSGATVFRA